MWRRIDYVRKLKFLWESPTAGWYGNFIFFGSSGRGRGIEAVLFHGNRKERPANESLFRTSYVK
jgi:hypothetical protein